MAIFVMTLQILVSIWNRLSQSGYSWCCFKISSITWNYFFWQSPGGRRRWCKRCPRQIAPPSLPCRISWAPAPPQWSPGSRTQAVSPGNCRPRATAAAGNSLTLITLGKSWITAHDYSLDKSLLETFSDIFSQKVVHSSVFSLFCIPHSASDWLSLKGEVAWIQQLCI